MTKTADKPRLQITEKVRQLRLDNKWTQARLAQLLGISQNWLSEIENGSGSLTAEQFLLILKTFNVPLSYFIDQPANEEKKLENSLARLGATHLSESQDILPTEKLEDANQAIRETLVGKPSTRAIIGLAPVIVNNSPYLNINKLFLDLSSLGYGHRLAWLLDNVRFAVSKSLAQRWSTKLPKELHSKYDGTSQMIFFYLTRIVSAIYDLRKGDDDYLEIDVLRSPETIEAVRKERSSISKKWGLLTRIQPEDFYEALRSAHEAH